MSSCPICKSIKTQELLDWKEFKIRRCDNCQLIFATPLPSDVELEAFYQGFLFKKPATKEIDRRLKKRKKELYRLFGLKSGEDGLKDKKFLDFGGGIGTAYKAASDLGLTSYYQDLDKQAIAFSIKNLGLTTEYIIEDLENCDLKFDYIFSDNVVEHVKKPSDFIADLINVLEDEGVMILKTPHGGNTETYFNLLTFVTAYVLPALKYNSLMQVVKGCFRRFWHCDPPRHLYSFSKESFEYLMAELDDNTVDYEIFYYKPPWLNNSVTRHYFSKDKKLKLIKSIVIRLIIWPIIPIEISLEILKRLLMMPGWISPGGIILRIRKKMVKL